MSVLLEALRKAAAEKARQAEEEGLTPEESVSQDAEEASAQAQASELSDGQTESLESPALSALKQKMVHAGQAEDVTESEEKVPGEGLATHDEGGEALAEDGSLSVAPRIKLKVKVPEDEEGATPVEEDVTPLASEPESFITASNFENGIDSSDTPTHTEGEDERDVDEKKTGLTLSALTNELSSEEGGDQTATQEAASSQEAVISEWDMPASENEPGSAPEMQVAAFGADTFSIPPEKSEVDRKARQSEEELLKAHDEIIMPLEIDALEGEPEAAAQSIVSSGRLGVYDEARSRVFLWKGRSPVLFKLLFYIIFPVAVGLVFFYAALQWYQSLSEDFAQKNRRYNYDTLAQDFRRVEQEDRASNQQVAAATDSANAGQPAPGNATSQQTQQSNKVAEKERGATSTIPAGSASSRKEEPARTSLKSAPGPTPKGEANLHRKSVKPQRRVASHKAVSVVRTTMPHVSREGIHETLLSKAKSALAAGEYDKVIELLKDAADAPSLSLKALAYIGLGKNNAAIAAAREALKRDPYAREAGEALVLASGSSMELSSLQILHERFPGSSVITLYLANAYLEKGDMAAAEELLSEAARLSPSAELYYNLAQVEIALGKYPEARAALFQALKYLNTSANSAITDADIAEALKRMPAGE